MNTTRTFLEYVAEDMLAKWGTDMSRIVVVFPNKRAALFMNEYMARMAGKPMWSPAYTTISELFGKHSEYVVGDSIKLVCDLHKSFVKCTGIDETLDHFYGWGQLLLTDFDDIDKNMADADKIFCNLKDIHELDDLSYLTDEQRELLKRFFANFSHDQETELKKRFLSLWSHFGDIYHDYNQRLRNQGIGYEGAIYREVATRKDIELEYDTYIFVGFNLLQKVEQELFANLKKAGKAHFYWDFDTYYMPRNNSAYTNAAGKYIAMYLEDFPNELDVCSADIYQNMRRPKDVSFVMASTENIQARYASQWLREEGRCLAGRKTAVVMCDEAILAPIIQSLPPEADKVNITSGFPLGMTPIASFVSLLLDTYTSGIAGKGTCYRAQYASKLLRHAYTRYISDKANDVYATIKEQHLVYPDQATLTMNGEDQGLALLFKTINIGNVHLLHHVETIIKLIGVNAKDTEDAFLQESVFRMYTIINRLEQLAANGDMDVDINTLRRLIKQLIAAATIPFHGEPVVGIQIMGVLETRNLDFKHLLLLSCNEGNMPKGVNDSSFIPYAIRKAHGLTTIDNKVAIYSYYFHRLLQRAEDITIVYNNTTDNGHTGEMSRFMLQMMVDGQQKIKHYNLLADNSPIARKPKSVSKAGSIKEKLDGMKSLSPSAINRYIKCPLMFFYQYVASIKEPDCEDDVVDNRMFGNIFHKSAQLIYDDIMSHNNGRIEKASIQKYLNTKGLLESIVDRAFNEELFKVKNSMRSPYYNGLHLINRKVLIEYLRQLLHSDQRTAPFEMLALEDAVYTQIAFETEDNNVRKIRIGGIIDRLDRVTDARTGVSTIRVVDYKTGIQATRKIKEIEEIFSDMNISQKHSDYYLQAILYSLIVDNSTKYNKQKDCVSPALLFVKQASKENYDPVLEIDSQKIANVREYKVEFEQHLKEVLHDIFNTNLPFTPTTDNTRCDKCAYRRICKV
ncbi:PD-(D/E)XK nuclease family protein [Prevotella sp.]|uniref:PD-(D/E)XK nuclease family protein n=1 Tax=Prevotella sp. TaxID=59823 RepID=UPI0025F4D386|nr:PD-(D/E)XK nuclease family protein [Prevotella sp.]MCI6129945.1 PD-(D/E)XK nuclease family protein [Prevotella sp.]MCI7371368.1 PD-(D/E)XK nuclease family protein [Prevotella sp.]